MLSLEQAQALKPGDKLAVENDSVIWTVTEVAVKPNAVRVGVMGGFLISYFDQSHLSMVSMASTSGIEFPPEALLPDPAPEPVEEPEPAVIDDSINPDSPVADPTWTDGEPEPVVVTEVPSDPTETPSEIVVEPVIEEQISESESEPSEPVEDEEEVE